MKDKRIAQIMSIGAELIIQKGYKGTTLQNVADNIGIHKSTIFHYFKSKEDLVLHILGKNLDDLNAASEKIINNKKWGPETKLKKAIENHLISMIENRGSTSILLNELRNLRKGSQIKYLRKRKKYEENFEKIIKQMKAVGYFCGLNTKIVNFGLLGMLNWVNKWYKRSGRLTGEEISDIFYRMIVNRGVPMVKEGKKS
jgi:AcrR family transcriptional regulator